MQGMTTFDPAKHPTGNDGRFVTRTAAESELSLPAAPAAEEDLVHPSGCLICGGVKYHHGMTLKGSKEFHTWQEPGPALRKERIKAVAAARKAAVAEGRTGIHFNPRLW